MSWLFSQALVAAFLPASCLDGELSAQSSGSPTQLAYLPPDKMTAFSRLSRFGMTFRPLTADRGEELLMSYRAAFHARTLASQEKARASQASAAECGDTWRGSLARFDPDTSSWKTVQHSLLEDSESSSVTWPRSGMTANGQCWELPTLERRIRGTGSGLWPTPVKFDADMPRMMPKNGDTTRLDRFGKPRKVLRDGRTASMGVSRLVMSLTGKLPTAQAFEALMLWPIGWTGLKPLATDRCQLAQRQHGDCLQARPADSQA